MARSVATLAERCDGRLESDSDMDSREKIISRDQTSRGPMTLVPPACRSHARRSDPGAPRFFTASVMVRVAFVALAALSFAGIVSAGGADLGSNRVLGNAGGVPFGVDPTNADVYLTSGLTCDGGATRLDTSQINDEYCDCRDGCDEPGTSACSNGRFHCVNRGHRAESIPSSRVRDGVCDCCDGSDEVGVGGYAVRVVCKNTCSLAGASRRAALEFTVSDQRKGLDKKRALCDNAPGERKEWLATKQALQKKVQMATARVETAKEAERVASEEADKVNLEVAQFETVEDAVREDDEVDDAREGDLSEESIANVSREDELEETDEDRGQRIARQWIKTDSEATGIEIEGAGGAKQGTEQGSEPVPDTKQKRLVDVDDENVSVTPEKSATRFGGLGSWFSSKSNKKSVTSAERLARARVSKATSAHSAAKLSLTTSEKKVTEITAELEKVSNDLSRFVGHKAEFQHMLGKCYSAKVDKYTYQICPFAEAKQDGVKLGVMQPLKVEDFESGSAVKPNPVTFKFKDGEQCWNGPRRSMTVSLICGSESKLGDVTEPSRCEYAAVFTTPAACTDLELETLELELKEMNDEVEEEKEL